MGGFADYTYLPCMVCLRYCYCFCFRFRLDKEEVGEEGEVDRDRDRIGKEWKMEGKGFVVCKRVRKGEGLWFFPSSALHATRHFIIMYP